MGKKRAQQLMQSTDAYGQRIHPAEQTAAKYLSNHILVNRVRIERGLPKLKRSRYLDSLAQDYATQAARVEHFHSDTIDELQTLLGSQRVGQNLCRGRTMMEMHHAAMTTQGPPRNNLLSKNFVEFGMATARTVHGKLYMVQFFRGTPTALWDASSSSSSRSTSSSSFNSTFATSKHVSSHYS